MLHYSKDFSDYADIAAVAADGWTVTSSGVRTTLENSGGPFGSGDKYINCLDTGSNGVARSLTSPAADNIRMACWFKIEGAGEEGNDLDQSSYGFMLLMQTGNVLASMGTDRGLRCSGQWDSISMNMGGAVHCNDGLWHHAEFYIKVSTTVGQLFLWLDGLLVWQGYLSTDSSAGATSPNDINELILRSNDFEGTPAVQRTHIAHPVVWDDVESSNSVDDLIGRIGPHRVNSDGSITTGITAPNASPTVFGINVGKYNLGQSGEFDLTFADMPTGHPLMIFGFSNYADSDDTVSAGAGFHTFSHLMTKGGWVQSTKYADAATGTGTSKAHREGYDSDFATATQDYAEVVSNANASTVNLGIVEVGSNAWTTKRVSEGKWENLQGMTVTGPGLQYDIFAIPNEMLENHHRDFRAHSFTTFDHPHGYEPDVVVVMSMMEANNTTGSTFFNASLGLYVRDDEGDKQRCLTWAAQSSATVANNDLYHEVADDKVFTQVNSVDGTVTYEGTLTQIDPLTQRITMSSSNSDVAAYFGFKFNNGRKVRLEDLTTPTSTGDQVISGIGFKPGAVLLFFFDAATAYNTVGLNACTGFGLSMLTEGTQRTQNWSLDSDAATTIAKSYRSAKAIKFYDAIAAAVTLEASLVSFDDDGMTLNWTTVKGGAACKMVALFIEADPEVVPEAETESVFMIAA